MHKSSGQQLCTGSATLVQCIEAYKEMTAENICQIGNQQWIYNLIVSSAFGIKTNHTFSKYVYHVAYIGSFNWFMLAFCAVILLISEENLPNGLILELLVYAIIGLEQFLVIVSLLYNKRKIAITFASIQNTFIKWSIKRGVDPCYSYAKNKHFIIIILIGYTIAWSLVSVGPLISLKYDEGTVPLDHYSHWLIYWPKVVNVNNNYIIYGVMLFIQTISSLYFTLSTLLHHLYFTVYLFEIKHQFQLLGSGIQKALNLKENEEEKIQECLIDCVHHHQELLESYEEFKKYFKHILLGELACVQFIFSILLYCMLKVDASIGYLIKCFSISLYWLIIFAYQCDFGDDIIALHKDIALKLYDEECFKMSKNVKIMVLIMFQRTQQELLLNASIFSSLVASKATFLALLNNIYKILNFLLKF